MEAGETVGRTLRNRLRTGLVIFFGAAALFAGFGFLVKLYEFFTSLEDPDILGFAVAPLVNYALVAGGFLALLVWAFLSGQFSHVEQTKHDLLEDQERYDREDRHLHPEGPEGQEARA